MMDRSVPAAPELIAPVQGAPVRGDAAKLTWRGSEGAHSYHVQVANDEAFQTLLVDTQVGTATALVVQHLTPRDQTVFWRVAAVGVGGRSPYSEAGEFVYSPAPTEAPYAGRTAEAGAETGAEAARRDPGTVRPFSTGGGEFLLLVAAILVSTLIVAAAFVVFPGLRSDAKERAAARDSVSQVLAAEQQAAAERLNSFTADSAGYTIPIDTAISLLTSSAADPVVLVDEGQ